MFANRQAARKNPRESFELTRSCFGGTGTMGSMYRLCFAHVLLLVCSSKFKHIYIYISIDDRLVAAFLLLYSVAVAGANIGADKALIYYCITRPFKSLLFITYLYLR